MNFLKGLRNGLTISLVLWLFIGMAFAEDIQQPEVIPDVTVWRLDTIKILSFTKTAIVTYRKGYIEDGKFIGSGKEKKVIFKDEIDNPDTPENEFSNEFTQFINFIEINRTKVKQAVKIKLELE